MKPGVDGRRQFDGPSYRAESIMGLAYRFLQYVYGGAPFISVRELHVEVDMDIGDMVAVRALGGLAGAFRPGSGLVRIA